MYTLKKGVMVLAVVFIMLLSGFFGRSLMYVMAEEIGKVLYQYSSERWRYALEHCSDILCRFGGVS